MRDFPKEKTNVREVKQVATNQVEDVPPKRNRFYALQSKGDHELSPYVSFQYVSLSDL